MKRPIKKVILVLITFSLSVISCSVVDQFLTTSRQGSIESGLTQTAILFSATPTEIPLPTNTPTPSPVDIILYFSTISVEPVRSEDGRWIWPYSYSIFNPNSYTISIVAFGDNTDGCTEDINSCSHSSTEFSERFSKCDYSGIEISSGATACDPGYGYEDTQSPESDRIIQNVVWYKDPAGNLFKVIGEPITLLKPSDQSAVVTLVTYLRMGPGSEYYAISSLGVGARLTIIGQANHCQWLQVMDSGNKSGWVSASNLNYSMPCGDIPIASFPTPPPTKVPSTVTPPCSATGILSIQNDTGGSVTLYLSGPTNFTFYLSTGNSTLSVCPGTYSYTAYGCGGATDAGTMSSGESHTFFCK